MYGVTFSFSSSTCIWGLVGGVDKGDSVGTYGRIWEYFQVVAVMRQSETGRMSVFVFCKGRCHFGVGVWCWLCMSVIPVLRFCVSCPVLCFCVFCLPLCLHLCVSRHLTRRCALAARASLSTVTSNELLAYFGISTCSYSYIRIHSYALTYECAHTHTPTTHCSWGLQQA